MTVRALSGSGDLLGHPLKQSADAESARHFRRQLCDSGFSSVSLIANRDTCRGTRATASSLPLFGRQYLHRVIAILKHDRNFRAHLFSRWLLGLRAWPLVLWPSLPLVVCGYLTQRQLFSPVFSVVSQC